MTKRKSKKQQQLEQERQRKRFKRVLLAGVLLAVLVWVEIGSTSLFSVLGDLWPFDDDPLVPQLVTDSSAPLAPFYAPEVLAWRDELTRWADEYNINPNVIAIIMQIESCGNANPNVISQAGAVGLMQVMPFHFEDGENMLNPDTNVGTGLDVLHECLYVHARGDLGRAFACYNGGPSAAVSDYAMWAPETQRYYRFAMGIWNDVVVGRDSSSTLDEWRELDSGYLCTWSGATAVP